MSLVDRAIWGCEVEVTDVDVTQYLVKMCVLIIVYFFEQSFSQLFGQRYHKLKKPQNSRRQKSEEFHTEDRQILDLMVQNVVTTTIRRLGFVYP